MCSMKGKWECVNDIDFQFLEILILSCFVGNPCDIEQITCLIIAKLDYYPCLQLQSI